MCGASYVWGRNVRFSSFEVWCQIVHRVKLSLFASGVKLSWCPQFQIVQVSNCPQCQIVLMSNCPIIKCQSYNVSYMPRFAKPKLLKDIQTKTKTMTKKKVKSCDIRALLHCFKVLNACKALAALRKFSHKCCAR